MNQRTRYITAPTMIAENRIPKRNITYIHRVKYRLNTSCVQHFSSLSFPLSVKFFLSLSGKFSLCFSFWLLNKRLCSVLCLFRFYDLHPIWVSELKFLHPIFNFYCSFICIFSRFSLQLGMSVSSEFDSVSDKNSIFL
jgi:hypothetical protein